MKHVLAIFAIVLFAIAHADAQPIERDKLVGTWVNTGRNFTQRQTFQADGAFEVHMTSEVAMMNRHESGKWVLSESTLKLTVEASTTEGRSGKSASFRVHKLTDDELVIQKSPADPNETVTFKRVK